LPKERDDLILAMHMAHVPWEERVSRLGMTQRAIEKRMLALHKRQAFLTDHHVHLIASKQKK
jgi:hypothetical protein